MTATPPYLTPPAVPPRPPAGPAVSADEKQAKLDNQHLKLLMVFHYVLAGLSVLGLGFLFLHYKFLNMMVNSPEMWAESNQGPPPDALLEMFIYFYIAMGLMMIVFALANALSARFIQTRRHRTYSLIVAGLDCLLFPFGTALGVFAFIVLLRDSVAEGYDSDSSSSV